MAPKSNIKTFFYIALAFIALGLGNVVFARIEKNRHLRQLVSAQQELAAQEPVPDLPLLSPSLNVDQQTRYINKLNSRIDFYNLVLLGGKCLLALGGVFLLLTLISVRQE